MVPIKNALISVYRKEGIVEMGKVLTDSGVTIYSTGGTARAFREADIPVTDVAEYTGNPEILDGRVKTLDYKIHAGILMRPGVEEDEKMAEEQGIISIDLVVCNLYPFQETVDSGASYEDCVEKIDIGGPTMIRAGAKNHEYVAAVVNPEMYRGVASLVASNGGLNRGLRQTLAEEAFKHTAEYDAQVAKFFEKQLREQ